MKLWKLQLQKLADETGLKILVWLLPPGTSKWNKVEHRHFSFMSKTWRAKSLISHEAIVSLFATPTTKTGLKVCCEIDTNSCSKGTKVSDQALVQIRLRRSDIHGDWNYTIRQRTLSSNTIISWRALSIFRSFRYCDSVNVINVIEFNVGKPSSGQIF